LITPTESNPSEEGVEGGFELDLAGARRLLGKIMCPKMLLFFVLVKIGGAIFWKDISSCVPLPDLTGFHQYLGMR
jgi:hypothetical protein